MKKFPVDCDKNCPYLRQWDLSIDDWTNVCIKLNKQIDDMDAYGFNAGLPLCPLDSNK
jgi:hypothetical protein